MPASLRFPLMLSPLPFSSHPISHTEAVGSHVCKNTAVSIQRHSNVTATSAQPCTLGSQLAHKPYFQLFPTENVYPLLPGNAYRSVNSDVYYTHYYMNLMAQYELFTNNSACIARHETDNM